MITKRTLERWRREALLDSNPLITLSNEAINFEILRKRMIEMSERILRLTRELLDIELIRRK